MCLVFKLDTQMSCDINHSRFSKCSLSWGGVFGGVWCLVFGLFILECLSVTLCHKMYRDLNLHTSTQCFYSINECISVCNTAVCGGVWNDIHNNN